MIIKKYLVKNMNEAMARIKLDLGSDAIIISQRQVRKKGLLGFFSPKLIEVTAASESEEIRPKKDFPIKPMINTTQGKTTITSEKYSEENLNEEVVSMKNMIRDIYENVNKVKGNDPFKVYKDYLETLDISKGLGEEILRDLRNYELGENMDKSIIKTILSNKVSVEGELDKGIKVFVGPTGVGKTTTIAKLAGKYVLNYKKKVGLITIDTYRIGAVEQLKTYAEIMNLPFKVVFNLKQMEEAIESMKDCDLILIDTTGRSSKNLMQIQELRAFVEKTGASSISLVLSATTKWRDIESIVEGYSALKFTNLILTKLDETNTYGAILDTLVKSKVPLSYVTVGQNVPEDIKTLDKTNLISMILGENIL